MNIISKDQLAPLAFSIPGHVVLQGDEGEARLRAAYPGFTWQRLAEIKQRYDPANLFHHNHNIRPA
jgi:FAD/FMN-containing dehydrogenase